MELLEKLKLLISKGRKIISLSFDEFPLRPKKSNMGFLKIVW
jgi:hypothetical protein